jgi:hypothetical protein
LNVGDELIEAALLLEGVGGRWARGFFLERQMHAFASTVLLWVAGLDAFDVSAEP